MATTSVDQVFTIANGLSVALKRVPKDQKAAVASRYFSGQFDRVLKEAKRVAPSINKDVWPDSVGTKAVKYVELEGLIGGIEELLRSLIEFTQ